jgi:Glycosyl hydrolase catalytic core
LRHIYISLGALLVLCSAIATSESRSFTGPPQPIDEALFGLHIHRASSGTEWPVVPFSNWRLWDADVAWPQLEPSRGKWDFTLLDRYVELAKQHHVDILLTLGLTPTWASSRADEASAYERGNAAEPQDVADWAAYVRTVATRYKGAIHNYEIWNEPNEEGTFTGSASKMVELSRVAYQTLKSVDPSITVVSPSATSDSGVPWLNQFLRLGGCQYSDAIGYHFYVTPEPPERMISLIQKVQGSVRRSDCGNKPIWNTESGWAKPTHFTSDEEAAGFLMRSYLLNWLLGVQRFYWYAWDNHTWSTLDLTSLSGNKITPVGAAYGVIHQWMLGAVLRSCKREHPGIWTCRLDRDGTTDRIMWSESGINPFTVPASWRVRSITSWNGEVTEASAELRIGPAPLLLESN